MGHGTVAHVGTRGTALASASPALGAHPSRGGRRAGGRITGYRLYELTTLVSERYREIGDDLAKRIMREAPHMGRQRFEEIISLLRGEDPGGIDTR